MLSAYSSCSFYAVSFTSDYSSCRATKIYCNLVHRRGIGLVVRHCGGAQKIWAHFLASHMTRLKAFKFSVPHFSIREDIFFPILSHMPVQYKSLGSLKNHPDKLKVVPHVSDYSQSQLLSRSSVLYCAIFMVYNVTWFEAFRCCWS